ncbi:MAG: hypothetical protein ABIZ04_14870 [Opitutus sp.]
MISTATLTGSLQRTYNTIFQHPVSHNLQWNHVHALFRHIAAVEEEHNGNLKVTRNGASLVLCPSRHKDVADTEELMTLRHFLERSEAPRTTSDEHEARWLLVIDHHQARLFRAEMLGAVPQKLTPHEPEKVFGHEQNLQNLSRGKEKPEPTSFFEPVAKVLQVGGQVLIFGTGTGKSSAMDQFVSWMKLHHSETAKRIMGSVVVDESHLTDGQLLSQAREFYANRSTKHR